MSPDPFDFLELGWNQGSDYDSNYRFSYATMTAPRAEGGNGTVVTQDEFRVTANSGSNTNDWFRTEYDWNAKDAYDLTDASRTWHHEYDSKAHEASSLRSNGNSTFNFDLSKSTGGDASGSITRDFNGGSGDEWHVDNNSNDEWEERDDYGASGGTVTKNKLKSKYKVDDVYSSTYRGNPSVSLNSDGSATLSGSSSSDEEYTFDQVSEEEEKSSAETTDSWNNDSAEGPAETSTTQTNWHLLESERREKTTDHYEAELSSDASLGSGSPPTLTGSDEGYTDTETFDKFCHTWDTYGTAGGPDCNETTTTNHEDWPSRVDEVLAMMQMEAEAEEMGNEGGDDGGDATADMPLGGSTASRFESASDGGSTGTTGSGNPLTEPIYTPIPRWAREAGITSLPFIPNPDDWDGTPGHPNSTNALEITKDFVVTVVELGVVGGLYGKAGGPATRRIINCFDGGTEVQMAEVSPIASDVYSKDLAMATLCIPVAIAGYSASRRQRRRRRLRALDEVFAAYPSEND